MKTPLRLLFIAVFSSIAGNATAASSRDLVARAVDAMGGEAALGGIKTITIRGQSSTWEPEASFEPGGKPRHAGDSKFAEMRDFTTGAARFDWEHNLRAPSVRTFKLSEIIAGGIGYVNGIDSNNRTRINLSSNPPGHPMSGVRTAATLRELTRQSPRLLLDMKNDPKAVKAIAAQTVDGKKLPAVQYHVRDWSFVVMFDPDTRLPARIRTLDFDPIQGDSNYDLVLDDWRTVAGAKLAHSLTYKLNGRDLITVKYDQVTANTPLGADLFEIPITARALAVRAAMGNVPYQWVIRRTYWGTNFDSDTLGWDPGQMAEPELVDIAPGVSQTRGTTHNSVVVEMGSYLVVFDAPVNELMSEWVIQAAKKRYPGKPVKYLMLTHHHWDHASGARTYVAEGATVIVGKGNKEHFARMFGAPGTAANDRLQRNPLKASIIEVVDRHMLKDKTREIAIYLIETQHSTGTLIGYIPDAKLGFVTDLWSPGRDPLLAKPRLGEADLVKAVTKLGIMPERFAGGHGSTAPFAPLLKLAGG
jgi:glyoxylase-like metal-dependent hydrolase (beta-lactamase superfamily II)